MGGAEPVDQIRFVAGRHQSFVVDEKDDRRNWDDAVFLIHRRSGVVEFEAASQFVIDRRRCGFERGVENAIELTGSGNVLGSLANFERFFEDVIDAGRIFRRTGDEGSVVEEKQFAADVRGRFFQPGGFVGTWVIEVEFVQNDQAGFFFLHDQLGDFPVLSGDAFGEVDHQDAKVAAADRLFGAHRGKDLDRVVALATGTQTGGVDQGEIFVLERIGKVDRVAGGAGDAGNDRAFILQDGVHQRGFAGVRFADDGELDADFFRDFGDGFSFGNERSDDGVDFIAELAEISAVFGGDKNAGTESEAGEIGESRFVFGIVDLVEDEQHWGFGFAELLGKRLVDRREAVVGINDKKDQIRRFHRDVRFDRHLIAETVVDIRTDTTGIDQRARSDGGFRRSRDAVAGDAGLVMDDRNLSPGEAIEERGFSDVRASDNGNGRHKIRI